MELTSWCYNTPTSFLQCEALLCFSPKFPLFSCLGFIIHPYLDSLGLYSYLTLFLASTNKFVFFFHQFLDFCEKEVFLFWAIDSLQVEGLKRSLTTKSFLMPLCSQSLPSFTQPSATTICSLTLGLVLPVLEIHIKEIVEHMLFYVLPFFTMCDIYISSSFLFTTE